MGSCLSKKSTCASSSPVAVPQPTEKVQLEVQPEKKKAEEQNVVKKEIFIIKHRKSHEVEQQKSDEDKVETKKTEEFVEKGKNVSSNNGLDGGIGNGGGVICGGGAPVRTSSCTKEEVDAILIQCGRLSRSSSAGKAAISSENGGRKYSGSKRSYDFDNENGRSDGKNNVNDGDDDAAARERENRRRERHRQSQGRRRTPSRERDRDQAAQQRSGSRERSGSGGGRRVSRSPGRRSESPITTNGANSNSSAANSRPGKMVTVPATVSSLAMDKSSNAAAACGETNTTAAVKRIQVKRNVGGDGARPTTASPRARSPARVRAANDNQSANLGQNQQQPISLSRNNSRKAENSPHRRAPLGEIDTNIVVSQAPIQKQNADNRINSNNQAKVINCKNSQDKQQLIAGNVGLNVISSGPENPKNITIARSRSSRLSRDLDINPETLSNPNAPSSSYTALLLEDIQNFHQKNTPPPPFSLPPCVTKACSILEAVADLNSSTTFADPNPNNARKTKQDTRDPILESEIVGNDDLTQPSFHKYVTVRRGATGGEDLEEQESSGSNSFVGSQQHWLSSSSCWEPNSAESTDRWTSGSKSVSRQKRETDVIQNGIGKGRMGTQDFAATSMVR